MSPKTPTQHPTPPRLTVKQVSEKLGVSTATISNAFNRPDQLSVELRSKILKKCEELGYFGPNPAARSLRTGSTGVVGVMLAENMSYNFRDSCAIDFLEGVASVLDEQKKNLLLMPGRKEFYEQSSLEAIPDRYIIYGPPRDWELVPRIEAQRKPIVTVDFSLPNHLALNVDNYRGARESAEYLFSKVSGDIAIIGLRLTRTDKFLRLDNHELHDVAMSISRQRLNGYLDAAKDAGITIENDHIWSTPVSSWNEGVKAARYALMNSPVPKALLCQSDQLALAAVSVARELGIRVPEDLKIVGFDGIPETLRTHPTLSTVQQPSFEKGQLAAMMVLAPENFGSRVLPVKFIARETTG
jgi:DNA-binding LacI/PurR family transcriptional regulator